MTEALTETAGIPLRERSHVLYRMFDADDRLLYVGMTASVETRLPEHRRSKSWWAQVATIKLEHFDCRADVEQAETLAIRSESPLFNIAGREPEPHTPIRSIRIPEELWDGLAAVYGKRQRAVIINDLTSYLLRRPGVKMPPRAPLPQDVTTHVAS